VNYDTSIKINVNREFRKKFYHILHYEILEGGFGKIHRFKFLCPCSGPWYHSFKVEDYPGAKKLLKLVEERLKQLKENYETERRLHRLGLL